MSDSGKPGQLRGQPPAGQCGTVAGGGTQAAEKLHSCRRTRRRVWPFLRARRSRADSLAFRSSLRGIRFVPVNVSLYLSVSQQIFIEPKAASYKVLGLEQGFVGGGEGQWLSHLGHGVHTHLHTRAHIPEPVTWGPPGLMPVDFMPCERWFIGCWIKR